MKRAHEIRNGKSPGKVTDIALYLYEQSPKHSEFRTKNQDRAKQWLHLQKTFEHIARRLTLKGYDRLQCFKKQGDSHEVAWNKNTVDLMKVLSSYC